MLHFPKTRADWLALRTTVVTSTEMPALVGESPYHTQFSLWHAKRNAQIDDFEAEGRMLWGLRLQDAIARGFAEDYGVKVRRLNAFVTHDQCRMGASFDYEIVGCLESPKDTVVQDLYRKHGRGICEVKNVDGLVYKNNWPEGEAPGHIEIQLQVQTECSGCEWGVIVPLIGGNRIEPVIRTRDRDVGAGLITLANEFWSSIDSDQPPAPDFVQDADLIRKVYGFADPGKLYDGRGNERVVELCRQYTDGIALEKQGKEAKDRARGELLTLIGSAEKAVADGYSVSAAMRAGYRVEAYDVAPRRDFRVTAKKAATVTKE